MVKDIWRSFRSLPGWVQFWVGIILVPVNLVSIIFAAEPAGGLIAALAIGGMAPNLYFMIKERGFSRIMAIPHVLIWLPLVILIGLWLALGILPAGCFGTYLIVLFAVNVVSLGFDFVDATKWLRGDRGVAGPRV